MAVDLPRVAGRHRNTALASARREAAISLVLSGATYQETADRLGYANRGTVYRIVHQALIRREVESIDELRGLECARLDAIQLAHWDAAIGGDVAAARLVLRVMEHRARLLGLFAAARGVTGRADAETAQVLTFAEDGSLVPTAN